MTPTVRHIWRHPIKSHGVEALNSVALTVGETMPFDRAWAVVHELSKVDGSEWVPCGNFTRGAKTPGLAAIKAAFNADENIITLSHPDLPEISFDPNTGSDAFLNWVRPIMPADRTGSSRIVPAVMRGMTDTDYPSVSLCNLASNNAVGSALGMDLSPLRWRGNLWLDGLEAWQEFDWVGKRLRVGQAEFEIKEPIGRCMATTSNPDTGQRDADTLGALQNNWGHKNFGIYGIVVKSGKIALGDELEVL